MSLALTTGQSQIITDIDSFLQEAFFNGVINNVSAVIVNPIQDYGTLTTSQQNSVKDIFKNTIAAFVKVMNIQAEFPPTTFTGTAVLAKLTGGGSNGSLVFSQGICTAYTAPT
jgi:hypothetical protein